MVMQDCTFLQKYQWKYIVIDEGHRIKNLDCKLVRELKSYKSANRFPFQKLDEYNVIDYYLPGHHCRIT